jgi:hypothetical protein
MLALIIDGLEKPVYTDESIKSIQRVCAANGYEINTDNAKLILAGFPAKMEKKDLTCVQCVV